MSVTAPDAFQFLHYLYPHVKHMTDLFKDFSALYD